MQKSSMIFFRNTDEHNYDNNARINIFYKFLSICHAFVLHASVCLSDVMYEIMQDTQIL